MISIRPAENPPKAPQWHLMIEKRADYIHAWQYTFTRIVDGRRVAIVLIMYKRMWFFLTGIHRNGPPVPFSHIRQLFRNSTREPFDNTTIRKAD